MLAKNAKKRKQAETEASKLKETIRMLQTDNYRLQGYVGEWKKVAEHEKDCAVTCAEKPLWNSSCDEGY